MSSEDTNEKVEPEKVLKGVLNTLMAAAPKTNSATTTPVRRTTPTSAFSTPSSRSFSSVLEDDDEVIEDFHLQYPSRLQPHLEMDTNYDDEDDSLEEDGKTLNREGTHVPGESPRSALDGIPFNTTNSYGAFDPTPVTPWNGNSPDREEVSQLGSTSHSTIDDSPERSTKESLVGSASNLCTPPKEPKQPTAQPETNIHGSRPTMPPLPKGNNTHEFQEAEHSQPAQNAQTGGMSSANGEMQGEPVLDDHRVQDMAPERRAQHCSAPVNLSYASSTASQSQDSRRHHNDTTLLASNARSSVPDMSSLQDMSQDASTFHNVSTYFSPERSFGERSVGTPQSGDAKAKLGTIHADQLPDQQNPRFDPRQASPGQSPAPDHVPRSDQSYQSSAPDHVPRSDQSYQSNHSRLGSGQLVATQDQYYQPHHQGQASPRQSPPPEVSRTQHSPQWNHLQQLYPLLEAPHVPDQPQLAESPKMIPSADSTPERSSELMYRQVPYEQGRQGSPAKLSTQSTPDRSFLSKPSEQCNQMQKTKQLAATGNSAFDQSFRSEPLQRSEDRALIDRSFQSEPTQGQDPYHQFKHLSLTPSAHSTPDRSYHSEPIRPSGQSVQNLRSKAESSNQSTSSEPTQLSSVQPSPGSRSVASLNIMDRFNKAQSFVRKVRGALPGGGEVGIPPKPPGVPPTAPPIALQAVVSSSEKTPLVSNQNRKTFSTEEKKEAEDWSAAAVKQMSMAVDQIRHFGESFIYDEVSPGRDSQSRVSEVSGQWWMKEQTFHTDGDDINVEDLTKTLLAQSASKPVGGSVASSQASPAPPPTIDRTPRNPVLLKPAAVESAGFVGLAVHPLVRGQEGVAAKGDDDDVVRSVGPNTVLSVGHLSLEPSTAGSGSRAMTPMMRMRVPGAQESVLMGDDEILPSPTEEASVKTQTESLTPRHNVEFAADVKNKNLVTPDRSRRSKSSRSSKGRSHGSSTRRSRGSRHSGRRRRRKEGPFDLAQCEGGIPIFLQGIIDRQCGQFLGDEYGSESTYSSGESGDESDGDTYGESFKSTPSRKKTPLLEMAKTTSTLKSEYTQDQERERPIDRERAREKERALERERAREELAAKQKELAAREKEQHLAEAERHRLQNKRIEQKTENSDKKQKELPVSIELEPEQEKDAVVQPLNHVTPDEERSVERVNRRRNEASNIRNKNFIREFIAELSKEGIKLLQHRRSHRQAFTRPTEVRAYLHLGTEAGTNGFCEPCLQFLAHDGIPVVSVDLFDVRSLEKATALQLQSYPFAVPGNSLLIRTNPGDFVFEAKDEEDAMRIVHGMRWLIARLSFNLIIGNVNVSCELLDVGRKAFKQRVGESNRAKAMNDLTNHLVDKSSLFSSS